MIKFKRITGLFMVMALMLTIFTTTTLAADIDSTDGEYLQKVLEMVKQKYNGNISEDELLQGALKGIFSTLDQYSTFYSNEEFEAFTGSLEGAVEGVGISVALINKAMIIQKVYVNSPASKAGVLSGDNIVQVNGESVVGEELNDVVSKIKGAAGTNVKLGLKRQGVKNTITLEIPRAQVDIPSVHYELRGDIGYISIDSFSGNASVGVTEALKYFDNIKINKIVLNLRNNPGGYVDQAISIAQNFVPKGVITTLDYKDPSREDKVFYSNLDKVKYKLAVLVNEKSASASEILTGAIKDTKAGVIIGNKTFGKAKVQDSIPILSMEAYKRLNGDNPDKSIDAYNFDSYESDVTGWAKMTIGFYYTPNGECIDLKGIEPNIKVAETTSSDISVNLLEPLSVTVKPVLGTQYNDVFIAECILKLLNYDIGTPDYILDKKTSEAIKKLQKSNKLSSSGKLDFTTQKLLNKKLLELKQKKDSVYAKAAVELAK